MEKTRGGRRRDERAEPRHRQAEESRRHALRGGGEGSGMRLSSRRRGDRSIRMESEAWISNNRNLLGALTPVPGEDSLVVVTGQWGRRDEEEEAEPRPLVPPIPRRRPRGWLRLTVGAVELARLRVWRLAPLADFLSFPVSWLRAGARGARCVRSPAACTGSFACGFPPCPRLFSRIGVSVSVR